MDDQRDHDETSALLPTGDDARDADDQPASGASGDDSARDRAREREAREASPTSTEKALTREERSAVAEHGNLSALTVYSVILREGEEELQRPVASLWWSGVAAGFGISTSVLVEGIIRSSLGPDFAALSLLESLGYTFGFVLVILCRLQLFTENTITVVLPILAEPRRDRFYFAARLWALVFTANLTGTFLIAAIGVYSSILSEPVLLAVLDISRHAVDISAGDALLRGIPAGFFIAALVWMLPSAKGFALSVIVMFTWLIAAGGFTHVIAGSNEVFYLVLNGELAVSGAFGGYIVPVLLGNIIGGTGLFAMLAYGQVHDEM